MSAYGETALRDELDAVRAAPEGARNATLYTSTLKIASLAAGGEIENADKARRLLFNAGLAAKLSQSEVKSTVNSAWPKGEASPRSASPSNGRHQAAHPTTPPPPRHVVTFGRDRHQPKGERVAVPDLAALADRLAAHGGREAWWAPASFAADYRHGETWRSSSLVVVDVDHHDAAGKHAQLPEDLARAIADAEPPATWHLTPRGLRLVLELDGRVDDVEAWCSVADRVVADVAAWLDAHGLAESEGRGGFRVDAKATRNPAGQLWTPCASVDGAARSAVVHVRDVEPVPSAAAVTPATLAARHVDLSGGALTTRPPPRRWLLRHPDHDGEPCAPRSGDGMLARGVVGIFAGEGGVSKTQAILALAVSIATGRPWLGRFQVDADVLDRGRVLLALGEEDADEVRWRLFHVCESLGLDPRERQAVADRVDVLALAGLDVGLLAAPTTGAVVETDVSREIRTMLADGDEWALVALDPLARFAGLDAEAANHLATRWIELAESIARAAPGRPTMLVSHHSSKLARRAGEADARGVTAVTDGARWCATLRHVDDGLVEIHQAKSNYSRPWREPVLLRRDAAGVLVALNDEEMEDRKRDDDGATTARRRERAAGDVEIVVEIVRGRDVSGQRDVEALARAAGLSRDRARDALRVALAEGLLEAVGSTSDRRIQVPDAACADLRGTCAAAQEACAGGGTLRSRGFRRASQVSVAADDLSGNPRETEGDQG